MSSMLDVRTAEIRGRTSMPRLAPAASITGGINQGHGQAPGHRVGGRDYFLRKTTFSPSPASIFWIWLRAWVAQGPLESRRTYARQWARARRGWRVFSWARARL